LGIDYLFEFRVEFFDEATFVPFTPFVVRLALIEHILQSGVVQVRVLPCLVDGGLKLGAETHVCEADEKWPRTKAAGWGWSGDDGSEAVRWVRGDSGGPPVAEGPRGKHARIIGSQIASRMGPRFLRHGNRIEERKKCLR